MKEWVKRAAEFVWRRIGGLEGLVILAICFVLAIYLSPSNFIAWAAPVGLEWELKAYFVMRSFISIVVVGCAFYVLMRKDVKPGVKHAMTGFIGLVLGYWLKG